MLTVLSLVTSVKDYIEIAHKLIESQNSTFLIDASSGQKDTGLFFFKDYTELGAILTYLVLSIKEFLTSFFSFTWFNQIWSLPLIVPDIASAMISEVSVLDSYFTNAFSFLETGLSTSALNNTNTITENSFVYGFEKFITGFLNSFFLFLPTSTSHLITLRRFVIQGLEAGYIAGLGTIAGNFLWLASIILGWRFFVIPWLSFDIFRYILGFSLLVKYLWDSSKEFNKTNRTTLEDNTKLQIFVLNFLLALTEQTSIYPFISNLSFGPEGSILETFTALGQSANSLQFFAIHGCYLLGILLGCLSLLQFTVWFWENPAFSIYMWMITSYRVTTSSYYKVLNFIFLYLTMLCAISSIPYFGLDYTITNPLGLIPQDRIIDQKFTTANGPGDKILQETSFLGVNPTDKNSRIRDGVFARRERWKERLIKYQAFDASLYDQGTYDILTIEDLNYGFDRFWLRRKLRNHQIRFRLFPGPWMRSLKKQLNKPGFSGPRVEFFRILFEQYYHPSFHATVNKQNSSGAKLRFAHSNKKLTASTLQAPLQNPNLLNPAGARAVGDTQSSLFIPSKANYSSKITQKGLVNNYSALRKFARNLNNRINLSVIKNKSFLQNQIATNSTPIYSKSLKSLFNRIDNTNNKENLNVFRNLSRNLLTSQTSNLTVSTFGKNYVWSKNTNQNSTFFKESLKKTNIRKKLSKKERLLLMYKTDLYKNNTNNQVYTQSAKRSFAPTSMLQPLNMYLQKDEAFRRKLKYYSTTVVRNLSVGNNAPYFKTMLKRAFYYHKPSLRWKRTMFTAAIRRGFRKKSSRPRKLVYTNNTLSSKQSLAPLTTNINALSESAPNLAAPNANLTNSLVNGEQNLNSSNPLYAKTASYSVLGKRASRYRYQIYKDVLQHWYYSPFNRLLLKFDIDSFINRQPKSHFLTKKEERLLHLRRILLSEHYNSLRWYTYMQHYRTMKSRIGGTKSFASTVYNQQFQGTFKKVRHLFSITPAQGDMPVLKFDQALYNSKGNLTGTLANVNLLSPYLHEENAFDQNNALPEDLIEQSLNVTGEYMQTEENSSLMAKILSAQQISLNNSANTNGFSSTQTISETQETKAILLRLLKECKRRLNDQTFLKNYITHRINKREQRNNDVQNELRNNLDSLKTWLSPINTNNAISASSNETLLMQTTGARKAINEGVYVLNNINPALSVKSLLTKEVAKFKISKQNLGSLATDSYISSLANLQKEEQIKQTLKSLKSLKYKASKLSVTDCAQQSCALTSKTPKVIINTVLKPLFFIQTQVLMKRNPQKNLEWWRQKQRVITNRKKIRKRNIFKAIKASSANKAKFKTNYEIKDKLVTLPSPEISQMFTEYNTLSNSSIEYGSLRKKVDNQASSLENANLKENGSEKKSFTKTLQNLFGSKFRKKNSSKGRRFRNMFMNRYFGAIRKPKSQTSYLSIDAAGVAGPEETLSLLQDPGSKVMLLNQKKQALQEIKQKIEKTVLSPETSKKESVKAIQDLLIKGSIKKSPIKKRAKRAWKKTKRQKFARNHYKYRKRRVHGFGKLRALNKKYKRIQSIQELQNWWWNVYLPNYIKQSTTKLPVNNQLQKAYQPLSTSKALEIRQKMVKVPSVNSNSYTNNNVLERDINLTATNNSSGTAPSMDITKSNILDQIYDNLLPNSDVKNTSNFTESQAKGGVLNTNTNLANYTTTNIPFYAGWDESLRKFVVTNRLLSRRDTGFRMDLNGVFDSKNNLSAVQYENSTAKTLSTIEYTKAPIQGLNEGSFLYLQNEMPFNSYIIDQFIPNNQSFYAPLGWKRFQFRHSLLKNWLAANQNQNQNKNISVSGSQSNIFLKNSSLSNFTYFNTPKPATTATASNKTGQQLKNRRLYKRNKLLRQTPTQLMYVPTGALLTDVLPSHYISVFDKQSRFPRNRYLKRYLPKVDKENSLKDLSLLEYSTNFNNNMIGSSLPGQNQAPDFTLRKRVKPRRKYHKKRFTKKDGLIFPRRFKFGTYNTINLEDASEAFRLRPSNKAKQNIAKAKSKKRVPKTNPVRLRQLRRREFQQVYKPLQRFQPRYGGFVWPGDYLRLEIIPMPKLSSMKLVNSTNSNVVAINEPSVAKTKVKQRKINVQPVGLLPRKYLLQKHNLKVFKKKMALVYK